MKINITVDEETFEALEHYSQRRGISLREAAARLILSGAFRLEALSRYNLSDHGRATRRSWAKDSRRREQDRAVREQIEMAKGRKKTRKKKKK